MSDYANKLSQLAEKRKKLQDEEKKIIESRKKYIGDLAEKHNLITATDEVLEGLFYFAKQEITKESDKLMEWKAFGEKFRRKSKTTANIKKTDKNKGVAA